MEAVFSMAKESGSERRQYHRINAKLSLAVADVGASHHEAAESRIVPRQGCGRLGLLPHDVNISGGGIAFRKELRVAEGNVIGLYLEFPEGALPLGPVVLRLSGVVVRVDPAMGGAPPCIALQFISLRESIRNLILQAVTALGKNKSA